MILLDLQIGTINATLIIVFLDPFLFFIVLQTQNLTKEIQTYFLSSNQCLFKLLFCFDIDIHVGIANQPPHSDFQSLFFFSILAASGKQPELFMVENQGNWILIKQWSSKLYHVIYSVIGRFYHLNYLIFEKKKKIFPFLLIKEFFFKFFLIKVESFIQVGY